MTKTTPGKEKEDEALQDDTQTSEVSSPSEQEAVVEETQPAASDSTVKQNAWKRFVAGTKKHKKPILVIGILLIVAVAAVFAWPTSRYKALGLVAKRDYTVEVLDSQTSKPISEASVTFGGATKQTDNRGKATFHSAVGTTRYKVEKKYYKTIEASALVPFGKNESPLQIKPIATGRQAAVTVVDKVSGQPVENAIVAAADSKYKTDKAGEVTLVLPATQTKAEATIERDGYNSSKASITISASSIQKNTAELTPAGKVYFLSNQSGKLDIVKTNLDGTGRQVVLAGTGKEDRNDTQLIVAPSGKYLLLRALRDTARPSLYVIDTSNDRMAEADTGNAAFTAVGWIGDYFTYHVSRYNISPLEPKQQSLKSYDAKNDKLITLDDSQAKSLNPPYTPYCFPGCQEVKRRNQFQDMGIIGDSLIYRSYWSFTQSFSIIEGLKGETNNIMSVNPDGTNKKTLKGFDARENNWMNFRRTAPQELTAAVYPMNSSNTQYYTVKDNAISPPSTDPTAFNGNYPGYIRSPSGKTYAWQENRDGKNNIFVGSDSSNSKVVATLEEYAPVGWQGDDRILLSKKSELYVMPSQGLADGRQPVKVSGFYQFSYGNYGYYY